MKFFRPATLLSLGVSLLLVGAAWYLSTDFAAAQGIVPTQCSGTDCQACYLVQLVQNFINFGVAFTIPVAVALLSWAGVLLFTGGDNPRRRDRAKKIFQSTLFGFIIALGAYLIVNTILHAIISPDYYSGSWFNIDCVTSSNRATDKKISDLFSEVFGATPTSQTVNSATGNCSDGYTYDSASKSCKSSSFTTGNCADGYSYDYTTQSCKVTGGLSGGGSTVDVHAYCSSSCTNQQAFQAIDAYNAGARGNSIGYSSNLSLEGVNADLLQSVINDASQSGQSITITSGTNGTHTATSNHYTGNAVDVSYRNSSYNDYMASNFTKVTNPIDSSLPAYKDAQGYIWSYENAGTTAESSAPHWHVSATGR